LDYNNYFLQDKYSHCLETFEAVPEATEVWDLVTKTAEFPSPLVTGEVAGFLSLDFILQLNTELHPELHTELSMELDLEQ